MFVGEVKSCTTYYYIKVLHFTTKGKNAIREIKVQTEEKTRLPTAEKRKSVELNQRKILINDDDFTL